MKTIRTCLLLALGSLLVACDEGGLGSSQTDATPVHVCGFRRPSDLHGDAILCYAGCDSADGGALCFANDDLCLKVCVH